MAKVKVTLKKTIDESYEITIESGLLQKIPAILGKENPASSYAVIADSNTGPLYGKKLLKEMKAAGLKACLIGFEGGEESKNLSTLEFLLEKMLENDLDRSSAVIALGGGVVGDVAGFAAACYMRGIPYIQLPTSLLAMVDSSSGGKVAVNLKGGKNSCGAFCPPRMVFIDPRTLKSLPKKEMRNGMAEVVKHAVIADAGLFAFIEKNLDRIFALDCAALEKIIKRNCEIKANAVEKDERERNFRKTLNYGHTVGHAIEAMTNYRKFTHGEAVAIGMNYEGRIAQRLGFMNERDLLRQNALLRRIGFELALPKLRASDVMRWMRHDKKVLSQEIYLPLPAGIGKMKCIDGKYAISVGEALIAAILEGS